MRTRFCEIAPDNGTVKFGWCGLRALLWAPVVLIRTLSSVADSSEVPKLPARELLVACRNALIAIESYEARVRVLRPYQPVPPGAETDNGGLVLFQEFERVWDRRTAKEMARGRGLMIGSGRKAWYRTFWGAWDGEKLRTFGEDVNKGQIIHSSNELSAYWSVRELLGCWIAVRPKRDLSDLLDERAALVDWAEAPAHVQVLQTQYYENEESRENKLLLTLRVWVDNSHGFLPARIEVIRHVRDVETMVLDRLIEIERFTQTFDGIWVPIEGRYTLYQLTADIPDGKTAADTMKMSKAEWDEFKKRVRYYSVPFEVPSTIRVDPKSLRVNAPIDEAKFTIRFPDGSWVYDEFQNKQIHVGAPPRGGAAANLEDRGPGTGYVGTIVVVNLLVVGVFCVVFVLRRRGKVRAP